MFTLGVLTCSTLGTQGQRPDTSGQAIQEVLGPPIFALRRHEIIPDDRQTIEERLRAWADQDGLDLVVTTGGTGLTDTDVTPEATRAVIEREVPGMGEAMRVQTLHHTPLSMISRSVVGVRGRTLIINLPGSPTAVRQCLEIVLPVLPHALELLRPEPPPHPPPSQG